MKRLCISYTRLAKEAFEMIRPVLSDMPYLLLPSKRTMGIPLRRESWEASPVRYSEEELDMPVREVLAEYLDVSMREYLIRTDQYEQGDKEMRVVLTDRVLIIEYKNHESFEAELEAFNVKGLRWTHLGWPKYRSSEYAFENAQGNYVIRLVRFHRRIVWDPATQCIGKEVEE